MPVDPVRLEIIISLFCDFRLKFELFDSPSPSPTIKTFFVNSPLNVLEIEAKFVGSNRYRIIYRLKAIDALVISCEA
jgi:hypothetical protein